MLIRGITLILFCAFIFQACENSTDVSTEPPYQDYIVINAQLIANKNFKGVTITHTLPLGTPFDIKKAEITNAVAYIVENSVRILPLHYTADGLYITAKSFGFNAGTQCELFAEIGGKKIYSKTIIPDPPEAVQVTNVNNQYLTAEVNGRPGEAYGAVWVNTGIGSLSPKASDFHSIETNTNYPYNVLVRTMDIPAPYNMPAFSNSFEIQVYAFDKAYKDYFITKTGSNPIDNTFISGGGIISGNVYGDNVIGLFIGLAEGNAVHP
jgi:hypothetical protein